MVPQDSNVVSVERHRLCRASMASAASQPSLCLAVYVLLSFALAIVLRLDSKIDKPSGFIKLRWFTRKPLSHGLVACSWDYEGSWRVGLARGAPDPLHLNFSSEPVLTCATIANTTAVSFVADPFLFIPTDHTMPAGFAAGASPWFAFYEMKNLHRFIGELGVAVSYDSGASWQHLGTALSEPFHLSYPLVLYDEESKQYLMFPETSAAKDGAVRVYGTTKDAFPFGWQLAALKRPEDPGWRLMRRWFQFSAAAKYVDTAPVRFRDRWWIFTTRVGSPAAGQPKYTLLLYTAVSLLGDWQPHPSMYAGAAFKRPSDGLVPYGVDSDPRTARNGGRPFAMAGSLYRWAQDCSGYYGQALTLMRADVANDTSYKESVAIRYEPTRVKSSWRAQRLHHVDVQQLPDGSWTGLVDGDSVTDGKAHFVAREKWFVEFKATLFWVVVLQLAFVITVGSLRMESSTMKRAQAKVFGGGGGRSGGASWP